MGGGAQGGLLFFLGGGGGVLLDLIKFRDGCRMEVLKTSRPMHAAKNVPTIDLFVGGGGRVCTPCQQCDPYFLWGKAGCLPFPSCL